MTKTQREALLALPDTEDDVVRHHSLTADDLAAIATSRTPETRLGYALQLCCLRYPGRYLRRGELLPGMMLDHIAEQIGADSDAIALFARRGATRYEQLATIRQRHGFRDFIGPVRGEFAAWAACEAMGLTDGRILLDRLIERMRTERIIIPGISVIERMAAAAMHAADAAVITEVSSRRSDSQRLALDTLLSDKMHVRQSRLSWLREPPSRVGGRPLLELLDKLALIRTIASDVAIDPPEFGPRMAQMAWEGSLLTAQAFQQMGQARRHTVMMATLIELKVTLTDAVLSMFQSLVGRANLHARKRLEEMIAASAEQGRARLTRIADVLDALVQAARVEGDIAAAVTAIVALDVVEADAALIRRTVRPGKSDVVGELSHEHRVFKQIGARFLASFTFEGQRASRSLLDAAAVLRDHGGDGRKPLPADLPLGHIERRWHRHVFDNGSINRTYYELATFFALASALASGDVWVPTSRIHRSLDALLSPATSATPVNPARLPVMPVIDADTYIETRSAELDAALLAAARGLPGKDAAMFAGGKLRFPKERKDGEVARHDAASASIYRLMPRLRITDMLDQVDHWTGFTSHFGHVSTGLPPTDTRAFMATLIAEATNLGLSRMAEVCGAGSRRALLRMQTWHMREETFRAALASLTDAIHAEPLSAWFGDGWRASADGQAFYLGGPGEAGGVVNAHYGRDAIVKIYTTITGRQAPLHGKAISGTAGEAIHSMDGILGHESSVDIAALHVDGGGVSDITPSLILKKLSAYRQQNSLAAAFREIGRIERTLFTLRWFEDPELRRLVTAELNKGEARNSLARAVAFHRLGRFRDRGHENQSTRASALNLVTAAIILFNCRYLGRVIDAMRHSGMAFDEGLLPQLSPLGWDHINFTGDYVWSDSLAVDADGFLPLRIGAS